MNTILNVMHVLLAIAMCGMILVQRGAGATAGAAFGSGASGTVFGSRGSGSFLTRSTAMLAIGFFGISLVMAGIAGRSSQVIDDADLGVMGDVPSVSVPAETGIEQQLEALEPVPTINPDFTMPAVEDDGVESLPTTEVGADEAASAPVIEEAVEAVAEDGETP